MFQPKELQVFYQHGLQLNHGMDWSTYVYDSETGLSFHTSENRMSPVLIIILQVMEKLPTHINTRVSQMKTVKIFLNLIYWM
jgi:hypothetical protein